MATPTIVFNNSTGSDTAASGAGPATALSGTSASFSGSVVTLDGSPDLSGVATDGSHVLWMATSTGRQFFTINAADNIAKTVTTDDAPAGTSTGLTWGIGGKRASLANANSKRLVDQAGSAGDAKTGWRIRFDDGYTETIAATVDLRISGDMRFGGYDGATTLPVFTFSNNGSAFFMRGSGLVVENMDLRNTNATKTASIAFNASAVDFMQILNVKCDHATNNFWKFHSSASIAGLRIRGCSIGNTAGAAITSSTPLMVSFCSIFGAGGDGLTITGTNTGTHIHDCIVRGNTGIGISIEYGGTAVLAGATGGSVRRCIIYDNGSDGIRNASSTAGNRRLNLFEVLYNIIVDNAGYGLNLSGGDTQSQLDSFGVYCNFNSYFGNTSGLRNGIDAGADDITLTADPFEDAAGGDFNLNDDAGGGADLRAATITMP